MSKAADQIWQAVQGESIRAEKHTIASNTKRRKGNLRLKGFVSCLSGWSSRCFLVSAGVRRFAEYGGVGRSQNRNVGKGVHICRALPITDSKPFLAGFFEAGIVRSYSVRRAQVLLKRRHSRSMERCNQRNDLLFGAAPFSLPVVPFFVVTGTDGCQSL